MKRPATLNPQILLIGDDFTDEEIESYLDIGRSGTMRYCDRRIRAPYRQGLWHVDRSLHALDDAITAIRSTASFAMERLETDRIWDLVPLCKQLDCVFFRLREEHFGNRKKWSTLAKHLGQLKTDQDNDDIDNNGNNNNPPILRPLCRILEQASVPTRNQATSSLIHDVPLLVILPPRNHEIKVPLDGTARIAFVETLLDQFGQKHSLFMDRIEIVKDLSILTQQPDESGRQHPDSTVFQKWNDYLDNFLIDAPRIGVRQYLATGIFGETKQKWYSRGRIDLTALIDRSDGDPHNPGIKEHHTVYGRLGWLWKNLDTPLLRDTRSGESPIPLRELLNDIWGVALSRHRARWSGTLDSLPWAKDRKVEVEVIPTDRTAIYILCAFLDILRPSDEGHRDIRPPSYDVGYDGQFLVLKLTYDHPNSLPPYLPSQVSKNSAEASDSHQESSLPTFRPLWDTDWTEPAHLFNRFFKYDREAMVLNEHPRTIEVAFREPVPAGKAVPLSQNPSSPDEQAIRNER